VSDPAAVSPLRDDELVFRRLPAHPQYFDPAKRVAKALAFRPTKSDTDGLSLARQCVGPEGAAALGSQGKQFYVAVLRVSDIVRKLGLDLKADRDDHAVVSELTHAARESKDQRVYGRVAEVSAKLTSIVTDVLGPFPGQAPPPPTAPPSPG
jgi:hypothetical protein